MSDTKKIQITNHILKSAVARWKLSDSHIAKDIQEKAKRELILYPPDLIGGSAMAAADRADMVRRFTSGRHLPNPKAYVIPAAFTAEEIGNPKTPSSEFLFRAGNSPDKNNWNFFSRHPDVAANYALGRRADAPNLTGAYARETTNNHGAFSAYLKSKLDILREQSTGNLEGPAEKQTKAILKLPNVQKLVGSYGQINPSYETIGRIKPNSNPGQVLAGQYGTKMIRLPNGNPGFEVSRISGMPISKVFGQSLVQRPTNFFNKTFFNLLNKFVRK